MFDSCLTWYGIVQYPKKRSNGVQPHNIYPTIYTQKTKIKQYKTERTFAKLPWKNAATFSIYHRNIYRTACRPSTAFNIWEAALTNQPFVGPSLLLPLRLYYVNRNDDRLILSVTLPLERYLGKRTLKSTTTTFVSERESERKQPRTITTVSGVKESAQLKREGKGKWFPV